MAERRVRLIDVAREAGTSVSTVSRALNGSDLISPEVVAHVRAVAGELGYRADKRAQEFKLGRPRTVGVTVPDLTNPFFSEVLKGLGAAARADGHRLLIGESGEDPPRSCGWSRSWRPLRRAGPVQFAADPRGSGEGARAARAGGVHQPRR